MPAFEIECAFRCNYNPWRWVMRGQFHALPNASVGHKNVIAVVIRYMKGGNWLSNVRITRDQTAEVLL